MKPLPSADLDHVIEHTRPLWEELRGQRIFITGGTGFFGKWLVETFVRANQTLTLGAQAVVLSRTPRVSPWSDISFVAGDVRTFDFPSGSFSHVIHAAATSSAPVPPVEMFDTIVVGTRRVLAFAERSGARKVLFVSSGAVYGPQPPDLLHVSETHLGAPEPTDPASAYGEGKRAAELLCRLSGLEAKIARCFAFVGPHLSLDAHFAAGNFLRDALAGGPIRVGGDGRPWRSYLYAADLAVWLWTILFRGAPTSVYNVGSEHAVTIAELAYEVAALTQPPCAVEIAQPAGVGAAPRYVPSTQRARAELGLREHIPLTDSLRRTFDWHTSR